MTDGVLVLLLLVLIWAAVLVPPAAGARAAREARFLGSIRPDGEGGGSGSGPLEAVEGPRFRPGLTANARKRQVLGGLMVAIGATLVLGLLPTFHLLLVVHLLLVNSCLAYVGLLVHLRDSQAAQDGVGARTGVRWQEAEVAEVAALAALADEGGDDGWGASGDEYDVDWEAEGRYLDGDGYDDGDDWYEDGGLDEEAAAAYVDQAGLRLARPA